MRCKCALLDPFLPRCCELATTSNDRQTKVGLPVAIDIKHRIIILQIAACELLHAIVLVMLGRAALPVAQDKVRMMS